ncbi:ATP-dependent Clp protease ATP-binding subunit ClpE [Paraliobacillus quinghaiensis]|uniref:ATP-dependent Clp protease ATP-binding subunit ClpE n=1 Tax=Paraliobacillus quinghaiensis TaxID=470815 RepID=A0A917TN84_9BACI|nr:ATP-dependent Clp protease ATP-binding subunit [Paraliobacillus quinghaiensis]GGM30022.1 ATP-dependent Clp protease ATP-binding subunit ClpE [Paraliobacillus quinghaiensis]
MKCQNCGIRPANINVALRFNNQMQEMHVCQTCFKEIQQKAKNPSGMFGGQNQGAQGFEDFFSGATQNGGEQNSNKQDGGLLDELGSNLSHAAKAGIIDPVIGREKEVKRVMETLNRRNKNNPVLIGEPGVGKTAIAEGLALKIAEGKVPSKLMNKEIYLLDVASLVANTGVRGQFEERMKQLVSELQQRKNVILFVDEIHLLVGAGTAEGSQMDAGNILKPALARGELQLVGATTLKEYRQIEKDAALERRFQPIMVKEPSVDEAVLILQGLQDRYEAFHHVSYTDEAIEGAVTLSKRYLQDRFLPDKAIDLMDEAGARLNLANDDSDKESLQQRIDEIAKEKEEAAEKEDYERAANLRHQEVLLEKKLNDSTDESKVSVTVEDIQLIIEEKTGIPVRKIQADEQSKMKHLAETLGERVIGQENAVQKVSKAVRRSRAGLKSKHRPIGSFLFVGPTGVGKTELTKVLAEELFGTKESHIRLDMSEYMEKHAVSKIIGSPPGYVGHEEAGQLTERVRRNPYSLILLDEIEKAHPDVQHMFLQIMEDGHLTDSHGRTVSFKDTVIIMTSNAGTGVKNVSVGFNSDNNEAVSTLEMLSDYFKPEFLNRFDAIIPFNELQQQDLVQIVDIMLNELEENVKEQGYTITVSDEAKQYLADKGYDPRFGARPLRRVIQDTVEDGITDLLLEEDDIATINVELVNDEIQVKKGN